MRTLKSHPLLRLVNSYIIDASEPSNISYLWNFGSLLAVCLVIQIITGVTLAMHVRCGNSLMSCVSITFVPSNANRSTELGKEEISLLNIASQTKANNFRYPYTENLARSFSYDETLTGQIIITTAPKLRGSLDGYRCITLLENCNAWFFHRRREYRLFR